MTLVKNIDNIKFLMYNFGGYEESYKKENYKKAG